MAMDILWHNAETAETQIWLMNGNQIAGRPTVVDEQSSPIFIGSPWSIVGTGDFDQNGSVDILWHNAETAETQIWLMNGNQITRRPTVVDEQGSPIFIGSPWSIVGTGDFDQNGSVDILWHNAETAETQIWLMNGNQITRRPTVVDEQGSPIFIGSPWSIVGTGDFDQNGSVDILWHNAETAETQIWLMNGNQITRRPTVVDEQSSPIFIGSPWSIVGTGDFDQNGSVDILWHNAETAETQIWLMNGNQITRRPTVVDEQSSPIFIGSPWSIVGAGEVNRNLIVESNTPSSDEQRIIDLVNNVRQQHGCPVLQVDRRLVAIAREHSRDLASHPNLTAATQPNRGHIGSDGSLAWDTPGGKGRIHMALGSAADRAQGENVHWGLGDSPDKAMDDWINHDENATPAFGHKYNIIGCDPNDSSNPFSHKPFCPNNQENCPPATASYSLIGVGIAKGADGTVYITQDFAG